MVMSVNIVQGDGTMVSSVQDIGAPNVLRNKARSNPYVFRQGAYAGANDTGL